jgi:hypothetical protein
MIIGENRVVERGGMLTACGTPDPSGDPDEQAHPVVNRPVGRSPSDHRSRWISCHITVRTWSKALGGALKVCGSESAVQKAASE